MLHYNIVQQQLFPVAAYVATGEIAVGTVEADFSLLMVILHDQRTVRDEYLKDESDARQYELDSIAVINNEDLLGRMLHNTCKSSGRGTESVQKKFDGDGGGNAP